MLSFASSASAARPHRMLVFDRIILNYSIPYTLHFCPLLSPIAFSYLLSRAASIVSTQSQSSLSS